MPKLLAARCQACDPAPQASARRFWLWDDDAGFFALQFLGGGELAAKEFDEAARAGAAIGTQQAHAIEKDQQAENFRILDSGRARAAWALLLCFVQERCQSAVEFARNRRLRRFLVVDSRT